MRNLPILALMPRQELQTITHQLELPDTAHGQ